MHRYKQFLVLLLLPLAACATKRDLRDLQGELRAMSVRQDSAVTRLERLTRSTQDSVSGQSDELFETRGEISRQLREILDQLARLQELTGQNQRSLASLRDQIAANRTALLQRPQVQSRADTTSQDGGDSETIASTTADAQRTFNAAVVQFNRGSFTTARAAFNQFLQQFPNHALAADAHFYLADILSQENRLEEAIEEFLRIQELYPTAQKVPEALYRAGALYLEMEDFGNARQYLERVVNSYPDHPISELAEDRLGDIP